MHIIITGALGHVGSKLIRELPSHFNDLHITMVDDLSTQRYCSLFKLPDTAKYKYIQEKIQNMDWDLLLQGVDVVIHLSAITDAAGSIDKAEQVFDNNFSSSKLIADACLKANVPLIFPSTTSVYGSQSELVDENCQELQPQSPYAECKINEENYILNLFKQGLRGVILRMGTIYGASPGMRFHTAVNKFCFQAIMNKPVTVWKTALHQKRPYLCLTDCCQVMASIIKNKIYDGQIYNIVSNNLTVNDVLEHIKVHMPALDIQLVDHQIMNQLSYEVSSERFLKTGYKFNGSLAHGIRETVELLRNLSH